MQSNDIGELRPFHWLLGKVLAVASGIEKQSLQCSAALLIIAFVLIKAAFDQRPRNRLEMDALSGRVDAREGEEPDYVKKRRIRP